MLLALPEELKQRVLPLLLEEDKLSNVQTVAQDVAALAMTCKSLNEYAKLTLWPLLGEGYEAVGPEGGRTARLKTVPPAERYERRWLSCRLRKLDKEPSQAALREAYKAVPAEVPDHIFVEVMRLRCLGTAATNAKQEFLLTDNDLKELPYVSKDRGCMGTAHVYRLVDLLRAARRKHGSVAGMEAVRAQRAEGAAGRKRKAEEEASRREEELLFALQPHGITPHPHTLRMAMVQQFVAHSKGASSLAATVEWLRVLDFARKHTPYNYVVENAVQGKDMVQMYEWKADRRQHGWGIGEIYGFSSRRKGDGRHSSYGEPMTATEEQDLVRLALKMWAGNDVNAALGWLGKEVPADLRDCLLQAMRQPISTGVENWVKWLEDESIWGDEEG